MNNRLKNQRKKKNLRQIDLSKKAGISKQAYINIEKHDADPKTSLAISLAKNLDTTVEKIF